MSEIAILAPVLNRPQNAISLVRSIAETTTRPYRIVFLCTPGDVHEIAACQRAAYHCEAPVEVIVCPFERAAGDFARKTNHGYRSTEEPWLFLGADDLRFQPGWDEAALRYGTHETIGVIGTNDIGNPRVRRGLLSTHSLVRRSYVDEPGASLDGPGFVYSESYDHNFVDEELVALARRRRAFAFAHTAVVEHRHPHWPDKASGLPKAEMDATYELALANFRGDRERFVRRAREIQRQPTRRRVA